MLEEDTRRIQDFWERCPEDWKSVGIDIYGDVAFVYYGEATFSEEAFQWFATAPKFGLKLRYDGNMLRIQA